jgi:hypothetical protein
MACLGCTSGQAFAQSPASEAGKWEIEVHGGGVRVGNPTEATTEMPAAGETFTATNGRPSRYVSSWYFGDGATLLNEHAAGFTAIIRSARITSLDPVLTGAAARSSNAGSFGFRIGRRITPRLTAEVNVDYGPAMIELSESALNNIEASRATFESVFPELLLGQSPLQFQNRVVLSSSQIDEGTGGEVVATGALIVKLRRGGALVPYVTGGLGSVFNRGSGPSVTLRGSYSFLWTAGQPFNEGDTVTVRWVRPDHALAGLMGGGFTYDLSRRNGFRVDLRLHVRPNAVDTEVSARPSVTTGTPAIAFSSQTTPSVQYSNTGSAETRSTLSGPAITAFRTREGSGVQIDTALTVGYFWRF